MEQLDRIDNPYQYGEVIDVQVSEEKKVICTNGEIRLITCASHLEEILEN